LASAKARIKNLVDFFSRDQAAKNKGLKVLRNLGDPFEAISAEEVFQLFQMCAKDERAFNALCTYARQHKKACGELTLEDIQESRNVLHVKKIMES
jgi:hypothetical protein